MSELRTYNLPNTTALFYIVVSNLTELEDRR